MDEQLTLESEEGETENEATPPSLTEVNSNIVKLNGNICRSASNGGCGDSDAQEDLPRDDE